MSITHPETSFNNKFLAFDADGSSEVHVSIVVTLNPLLDMEPQRQSKMSNKNIS